jgi:CDP-4-dehydro-6-deoxyglucose reductase
VEGQVDYGHVHPTYLPLEEREQGYALLCQAQPLSNLVIEVQELDVMGSIRSRVCPGRVMEMRRVVSDVMIVRIKLPMNEDVMFLAGQFVEFDLANGERRAYSIASAPSIGGVASIELHVRHTPGGLFTDYVFDGMRVHDLVRMELPQGTFFLREESDKPIVLLASGTGFAPMKAILRYAQQKEIKRPMTFYWGGRTRADLYEMDWVERYAAANEGFQFIPVVSDATPACGWNGRTGFVHRAVMEDFPDLSKHQVYACGAPIVIESAKRDFAVQCAMPPQELIEPLGAIPVGTRKIRVRLDIDQVSGATPNLAIDDVTLEIDPGDLRYLTFAVWQVSAQVGRGFESEATVEITP